MCVEPTIQWFHTSRELFVTSQPTHDRADASTSAIATCPLNYSTSHYSLNVLTNPRADFRIVMRRWTLFGDMG